MTALPRSAFTLALVVLGVACGRRQGSRVATEATPAPPDSVFVAVVNDNYYDARIHVIYAGGARYALGTIAGNRREPVRAIPWLPRSFVVEVKLVIGGGVYRSDAIDLAAGDIVEIRVPVNLAASGLFRRISR